MLTATSASALKYVVCHLSDMSDMSDESDESDSLTKKIKKPPYGSFLMIWDYSIFNKVK